MRRLGAVVLVCLVLAVIALAWAIRQPRHDAARLLGQVRQLRIGTTPYQQVFDLVKQYPGESVCYENDCSFRFENTWMHRLGLAPLTQLQVVLHRSESRLSGINLAMLVTGETLENPPRASAMVFDHPRASLRDPAWRAVVTGDAKGRPVKTYVQLSPDASPAQRQAAFDVNLGCLTRRGGCGTSRELLPDVWTHVSRMDWVE